MKLSIIVAKATNNIIGRDNDLPWHLPEDLQYFKKITMGKPILMGRRTFESIGRVLPGRINVVITKDKEFIYDDVSIYHSIEDTLEALSLFKEVFIIGGESCYQQFLEYTDRLYITQINRDFEGDTYFPEIQLDDWIEIIRKDFPETKERNFSYSFLIYERNKKLSSHL